MKVINYLNRFRREKDIQIATVNKIPKISVVIPVYNIENYIGECIESVLQQTFNNIEIVCINDGSTDHSLEVLQKYAKLDERIHIINQSNRGLSAVRNLGIQTAIGDYIYFLDGDDYIHKNALEKISKSVENEKVDILLFNGAPIFQNEKLAREYKSYVQYYRRKEAYSEVKSGQEMLLDMIVAGDFKVSCCLQVFRREFLIENHILFKDGVLYEDNVFTLTGMLKANRVKYLKDVLFLRRIREGSISTTKGSSQKIIGYYEGVTGIRKIAEDVPMNRELKRRILLYSKMVENKMHISYQSLETEEKEMVQNFFDTQKVRGVSIITATNKEQQINTIIENYKRQYLWDKELILVLNKDSIDMEKVKEKVKWDKSIHVYQLPEECTLGECLNHGVEVAMYPYISKFDDDDYYGENYLVEVVNTFEGISCDLVGKSDYYTYLAECNCLCEWIHNTKNDYAKYVAGGTINCKRTVANTVPFDKLQVGTDRKFMDDLRKQGYKIYSISNKNYLYIRTRDNNNHTWKVTPEYYINNKRCKIDQNVSLIEAIRRVK